MALMAGITRYRPFFKGFTCLGLATILASKADPNALGDKQQEAEAEEDCPTGDPVFPYFLIGGYGYMAWMLIDSYRIEEGRIKSLKTVYGFLSDRTADEIDTLKYGLSSTMAKHKVKQSRALC